jgi:methylthioribose-1-phosphate isomerase
VTDEVRAASQPAAPEPTTPADPDEAMRLARRRFFRTFAGDAMKAAATVVGAAGALREGSAGMASMLFGTAEPAAPPVVSEALVAPAGTAATWRSTFRVEREQMVLLDQRRLPDELVEVVCLSGAEVAQAFRESVVRGAPLLGQLAACGLALTAERSILSSPFARRAILFGTANALRNAAPTAAPVRNAMDRMLARLAAVGDVAADGASVAAALREEADAIVGEAIAAHARLAAHGATLLASDPETPAVATLRILTIGSTGELAGGQVGTALAIVRAIRDDGRDVQVLVAETRPWLAGARLVAWELAQAGIGCTLVGDGASTGMLARGEVDAVLVGAESIAGNGDVATDPGSYGLAVVAHRHAIPFVVAAPLAAVDHQAADGEALAADPRPAFELLSFAGRRIAPQGTAALNPSVDIVPASLVSAIVTEAGVFRAPYGTLLADAAAAVTADRPAPGAAAPATAPAAPAAAAGLADPEATVVAPTDDGGSEA